MNCSELLESRALGGFAVLAVDQGCQLQHCRRFELHHSLLLAAGVGGAGCCGEEALSHCRLLSGIPGLHLLNARSISLSCNNQQCLRTLPHVPPGHSQPPSLQGTTAVKEATSSAQSQLLLHETPTLERSAGGFHGFFLNIIGVSFNVSA